MKRVLPLLFICLIGCRVDVIDEVAPQSIARTWQIVRSVNGPGVVPVPFLIEFTRKGQLLYGNSKVRGGCCEPETFKVIDNQIQFYWVSPLPEICAATSCAVSVFAVKGVWQIEQLDNRLVLRSGNKELNFVAQ